MDIERAIKKLHKLTKLKKRYKRLYKEFWDNYRTDPNRDRLFHILDQMDEIELALMSEQRLVDWIIHQIDNLTDEQVADILESHGL